jgi:hypothetical protein
MVQGGVRAKSTKTFPALDDELGLLEWVKDPFVADLAIEALAITMNRQSHGHSGRWTTAALNGTAKFDPGRTDGVASAPSISRGPSSAHDPERCAKAQAELNHVDQFKLPPKIVKHQRLDDLCVKPESAS